MLVYIPNPAQNEYSCSIIQTMGSCTNFCHYCILFQKFLGSMNLNTNPCLGTISLLFHAPIMFEWDCVWDRKVWNGISCFQPFILCLSAGLKNFSKYRKDFFWRSSFVIKGNIWVGQKLRPETKFQILFDQFGMSRKISNFCDNIYFALKSYRTIP